MMKPRPDQGGFSLIEMMVAIGILAIGAAMIASAFPVAMLENKESVEHTMAALASENALAICRNKLRHSILNNRVAVEEGQYSDQTEHIALAEAFFLMAPGPTESEYPQTPLGEELYDEDWITVEGRDYPSARYGWMVGARQIRDADGVRLNDYELSIVVYQKFLPTDRPGHELKLVEPECKKVDYVPEEPAENPNPRDPTIGRWVVRASLRP